MSDKATEEDNPQKSILQNGGRYLRAIRNFVWCCLCAVPLFSWCCLCIFYRFAWYYVHGICYFAWYGYWPREEDEEGDSELWDKFLQDIKNFKPTEKTSGHYWLHAMHTLTKIDDIKNILPDEHPLKLVQDLDALTNGPEITRIAQKLQEDLKTPKGIKKIDFSGLSFKDEMNFENFIFPIDTYFSNATFEKNVFFNNAIFLKTADFENTTFQKEESYSKETAKFRNIIFSKIANFRNATFWGYANFKGAQLKGRAFFQEAKFKHHAPRFYDAEFNNEITWAGIKLPNFKDAPVDRFEKVGEKFEPLDDRKTIKKNQRRRIEENQNSYENIAILLEQHNKYHDRHFFFRQEMRCRRWLERPLMKTFYLIYEYVADYGYGMGRAFLWWFAHIAIGAVALVCYIDPSLEYNNAYVQGLLSCVLPVSFSNANPYAFVGFESKSLQECYANLEILLPITFGVIRIIQTIVGVALLFLLLLTLRVRFRIAQSGVQIVQSGTQKTSP